MSNAPTQLDDEMACHFRDELRRGRDAALRDAEAFDELIFVIERLGSLLHGKKSNLHKYQTHIAEIAETSPLSQRIPDQWPQFHTGFDDLYKAVEEGRNMALHQGAFARHLTTHVLELSLVLEHALMVKATKLGQYMVRTPECARLWYPLSFVRRKMLLGSFSYLPVQLEKERIWKLVSDVAVARYLREKRDETDRRLMATLREAVDSGELSLDEPNVYLEDADIDQVLSSYNGRPCLICDSASRDLIGIATAFDLL